MKLEWKVALARLADAIAGRQSTDAVGARKDVPPVSSVTAAEEARSDSHLKAARRHLLLMRIVGRMVIFLVGCWVLNLFSPKPLSFGHYAFAFIASYVIGTLAERRLLRARTKTLA